MVINGFGLKSPQTSGDPVPEKFRFLIKMKPNDEQAPSQFDQITNDSEIEYDNLISGFDLVSDIDLKDDKFTEEWQVKKFLFTPQPSAEDESGQAKKEVSEVLFLIDRVTDKDAEDGIQLGQILLYQ